MEEHYIPLKQFHRFVAVAMNISPLEYFEIDKERALFQFLELKFITFRLRAYQKEA